MEKKMKQIVAGVKMSNGRTRWTRIGTAFENKDGSWNQLLDFYPAKPDTTIQMRDIDPREDQGSEG